jgi:chromosome segregation ATPase
MDASMSMLHASMKTNAKAYEYLFENAEADASKLANDGTGTPWVSAMNRLYQEHASQKSQWKKDLKSAKQRSKNYKEELRDTLAERLKVLESKVLEQDGGGSISRASSTTRTTHSGTTSEGTGPNGQEANAENVEVVYQNMTEQGIRQRVRMLEQRLKESNLAHSADKTHWIQTLNQAAEASETGVILSDEVQGILQQVASDWQEIHNTELVAANEEREHLRQRVKQLEGSHAEERILWQEESAKLKDDSRHLLQERNEYKRKLSRHKDELENSKSTLAELERKVELCHRQTTLAQKKATQWEDKAASMRSPLSSNRRDPPTPDVTNAVQQQLKKAMHERDTALQEAEKTIKMLEDYQNRLEKDRASYNSKLKQVGEKSQKELQRRMEEFKNEQIEQYRSWPLADVPHPELERRYTESVEKRNELASRMRLLQEQLSTDKGSWKLQLETSLAKNRKLEKKNQSLQAQITSLGEEQKTNRVTWEASLDQASKEWIKRLTEIQEKHEKEKVELMETMSHLQAHSEDAETLAMETRSQLAQLAEKHRQDILEWKEREVHTSQKNMFDAKEKFAVEMNALHNQIARIENERSEMQLSNQQGTTALEGRIKKLEAELKQVQDGHQESRQHHDQVLLEWENHANKLDEEKIKLEEDVERLKQDVVTATGKAEEFEHALEEVLDEHDEASVAQRDLVEQHEADRDMWLQEKSELEQQVAELTDRIDRVQTEKQQRLAQATAERRSKAEETDHIRNILQRELAEWKLKVTEAGSGRDATAKENAWLRSTNSSLETDMKMMTDARKEDTIHAAERIESLEQDNEQHSILKGKYDKILDEKERLVKIQDDQRRQLVEWTQKVGDLEASWMRRIDQLRGELKKTENASEDKKEEIRGLEDTLEKEREEFERRLDETRSEMSNQTRTEYEDEMRILKDEKASLVLSNHEKIDEIANLQDRLSELENAISQSGRGMAEVKALHAGEVQEWKERLDSVRREYESKLEKGQETFLVELDQWKEKVRVAKEDFRQKLDGAQAAHRTESKALQEKLTNAEEEVDNFTRQTTKLTTSVEQLQRAHDEAKRNWKSEGSRLQSERDRLATLLNSQQEKHQNEHVWNAQANHLQQHQHSISSLVEDIRGDVKSVRDFVKTSVERNKENGGVKMDAIQEELQKIQGCLNDTLSTMTNETEALLSHRDQLNALVEASVRADEAHQRFFEQQERLVSEMKALRSHVYEKSSDEGDESSLVLDKVRMELVDELHRRETALARKSAEVINLEEELAKENGMREKAELEILALNDQADAYGEELMRLQGINKDLEDTMHEFEERMDFAIEDREDISRADDAPSVTSKDDSSPLLDEAMALGQALTDIVHGSSSDDKETSVMAMLETLSDMMDQHDREKPSTKKSKQDPPTVPLEVAVMHRSPRILQTRVDNNTQDQLEAVLSPKQEAEPLPVTTPPSKAFFVEEPPLHLQLIVEQLYGRCQLLERERTSMMESTLELLQAARDANEAELEAALSTARRHSAEELLKVQDESRQGMWRMYNKLCNFCMDDVKESS